jgi:predicted ATPase
LHISGEQEYPLEPLLAKDAAALFVERARAIGREVAADSTVDAICRRLDGLPLAVELAAARTRLLSPATLLERLETALPVLTGGTRDAPERHRTLRDTIQWSYDLVDPGSRELFTRLPVFAGSFELPDAQEVCDADLDGVGALVDSSLLKPLDGDRFMMLETIRDFALERLACCKDAPALREKHAAVFLRLAERAYENRFLAESQWSRRLALDHDNFRAALDWLSGNDPDRALELAGAMGWFWLSHGFLAEGRGRLITALARSSSSGSSRARALTACGPLTARQGDIDHARAELDEGIDLWRSLGDLPLLGSK